MALTSELLIWIPNLDFFLILDARISNPNMKRRGESGFPCRTPGPTAKLSDVKPLLIIQLDMFEYRVWIHWMKDGPKLNMIQRVERFFKINSHKNARHFLYLVYSIISSILLIASRIDQSFTHSF